MNSTDGAKNIKMDKGVITVNEAGSFFLIAAAQVGGIEYAPPQRQPLQVIARSIAGAVIHYDHAFQRRAMPDHQAQYRKADYDRRGYQSTCT